MVKIKSLRDAKVLNDKAMMARLVTVERRVLTGSLHIVPNVQRLFTCHMLNKMGKSEGRKARRLFESFMPPMWRLSRVL